MSEPETAAKEFFMFDYVPIGICVLRKDYVVLFWNNCLEDWTGIGRDRILGTNIALHFPDLKASKYQSRLKDIFEGGPPTIFSSQLHKNIFPSPLENGQLRIQHTTVTSVSTKEGQGFSEMKSFDLVPFFNDFAKFVRRTIPENIDISAVCPQEELFVRADPSKLQQVLTNLTLNARDAMPEGGSLILSLSSMNIKNGDNSPIPEPLDGEWVVLEIADTGTGIKYEILPHIFEPFFTTKEVGKGTGLGLSQVYGIIKQHDGHVELKTEPGKGCSFKIYLPASKLKADAAPSVKDLNMPKGHSETILVVEDNETICNLVKRKLSKLNYNIITATNGIDALKLYEDMQDEIKLVLTDLVMPRMGGLELSKKLISKTPSLKIIALSGYPLGSKMKDLTDAGIIECIQKPFSSQDLVQAISKALGKS